MNMETRDGLSSSIKDDVDLQVSGIMNIVLSHMSNSVNSFTYWKPRILGKVLLYQLRKTPDRRLCVKPPNMRLALGLTVG